MSRKTLLWAGLVLTLVLAGVVSFYASASPDGLEKVATDQGFIDSAQSSATAGSPLADYSVSGVNHERLAVGIAGVVGALVTFALAVGLLRLVARRRSSAT